MSTGEDEDDVGRDEADAGDDADELTDAIEAADTARLERLLADRPDLRGIRPGESDAPLQAAWYRKPDLIPWLLPRGVSPDQRDSGGGTVLMHAAADDATEVVALLIAAGADLNVHREGGETAFSYACAHDAFASAKLLHAAGAEVNGVVDEGGGSPLDWAACWASWPFYEWLVSIGCRHLESHPDRTPGSPPPFGSER
jgi:ankyrin repeat protein